MPKKPTTPKIPQVVIKPVTLPKPPRVKTLRSRIANLGDYAHPPKKGKKK